MEIVPAIVEKYIEKYTSEEDNFLKTVSQFTAQNHPKAHMMSGQVQGKFLEMMSFMLQPKRILEIGTFTGYSALCLAKGLPAEGLLHTIELREQDANKAQEFFNAT